MNLVTPKAGAKHELLFNELASGLGHKHLTRLERSARDKHTSLLRKNLITAVRSYIALAPGNLVKLTFCRTSFESPFQ